MGSLLQLPRDSRLSRMEGPKVAGSPQGEGTALRSPQAGLLQEPSSHIILSSPPFHTHLQGNPTSSALKHPERHSPTIWATTSSCPDDHLGPQTGLPASTFQQWVLKRGPFKIQVRPMASLGTFQRLPSHAEEPSPWDAHMLPDFRPSHPHCSHTGHPTAPQPGTTLPCPRAFACSWACYALP